MSSEIPDIPRTCGRSTGVLEATNVLCLFPKHRGNQLASLSEICLLTRERSYKKMPRAHKARGIK
jgi:hypothetical protein